MTMTAVIYTRVSSKEQAENNMSLSTQLKRCNDYAANNGYKILGYFGGTYESAKNDERKEFKRMLQFIKTSKEKVSHILVYSSDRFSRSGPNSIFIASELLKEGIRILPVTQPIDTGTPEGQLQQSIQFIFNQYDNENRRKKTVDGMKEMLRRGYTSGSAPFGYTHILIHGKQDIRVNDDGEILRLAFSWKADEKMTTAEISERLSTMGVMLTEKHLSKIFRNPYYCGLIANTLLDGELVEGKHEAMISRELFLRTNDVLAGNTHAYTHKKKNDDLPLKRFLVCDRCQRPWVGYIVKKKRLFYYKCNQKGCKCNKSAKEMHKDFLSILEQLSFKSDDEQLIRERVLETYSDLLQKNNNENRSIQLNITALRKKILDLKQRHAEGKVELDVYQEYKLKFEEELNEILKNFTEEGIEKSNLENFIKHATKLSQNLHQMWLSGDYDVKQKLQSLVFPEGIRYNKENGHYRTENMNLTFLEIWHQTRVLAKNKGENQTSRFEFSPLVPRRGIEPLLPP